MMTSFAIYRLPHQQAFWLVSQDEGEPKELRSLAELNGRRGFVVAPFAIAKDTPVVMIEGESRQLSQLPEEMELPPIATAERMVPTSEAGEGYYHIDFCNFHANLLNGDFRKIVLSRSSWEQRTDGKSPLALFAKACRCYPRMFVSLVSTPRTGMWLTATPETLLEGEGKHWRTIALAGTKQLTAAQQATDDRLLNVDWDTKNIQEQRYVATYIVECLEHFSHDISEEGPYTARAANLAHLRSDFNFTLDNPRRIGELLRALHPTPAVCGLPKQRTFDFIIHNELRPRRYYSGFSGPMNPEGETHLFVSLRCMQIFENAYQLYAGGGLLRDSVERQEWEETEAKMETMRRLLRNS